LEDQFVYGEDNTQIWNEKKKERETERETLVNSHTKVIEGQHTLDWAKCIKQIYTGSPGSDQPEYSECCCYSYTIQK
jgi:hypothetical protein